MQTQDGSFGEVLPCLLDDDEVRERGKLLAMTLVEIARIRAEFQLERKRIKGEIETRTKSALGSSRTR